MGSSRVVGCLVLAALTACSGTDDKGGTSATAPVLATTTSVRADDLILRIGLLHDVNAPPPLDASIAAATKLAVDEINGAGGVDGQQVSLVEAGADANTTADAAIDRLLDADVDAIIGPLSSNAALANLAAIVDRGVLACSPTASAIALDQFPDRGLFFRTVPSDTMEADALATAVERAGAATVALAYLDDPYGRAFADAVRTELQTRSIDVGTPIAYSDASSITAAATSVASTLPTTVVVIADDTTGPTLIADIDRLVPGTPAFFVNDAQRRPADPQPLSAELAARVTGVSPATLPTDPALLQALSVIDPSTTGVFAANAYDCVNLIALAATSARSTLATDIAMHMVGVSSSGSKCTMFAGCRNELVLGRNVDYDGPSRVLDLAGNGDPARALFEEFTLKPDGHDEVLDRFPVTARSAGPS